MIRIADVPVPLDYGEQTLRGLAAARLHLDGGRIKEVRIEKCAVDSGDLRNIHFKMTLLAEIAGDEYALPALKSDKRVSIGLRYVYLVPKGKELKERPVVVGCGPAGLFAALILAQADAGPILLERGADVDSRRKSVEQFWETGDLDLSSNVQFGEGGAGAFSDGKLKIGSKDYRKDKVLKEFVEAGAPPEILYLSKPHVGTDRLGGVVKRIREKITKLGGEVHFGAQVTEILHEGGSVRGVRLKQGGAEREIDAENIVLAVGHSARDTFGSLLKGGIRMEQRPFGVGVRIEHPQGLIDKIRYGGLAGNTALGAADYKMVAHLPNGRGVYTFCMCPGGKVVAGASEENCLVTNGMSEYARDGQNANCALLVTVFPEDFGSESPLAGVVFQRGIEKAAFAAGGGGYRAPVQRLEDFMNRRRSAAFGSVLPTYRPGVNFAGPDAYLPGFIADSLRQGILEMDKWMPGFAYPDALLTGAETRSTSPVRIARGENLEAAGIRGLYPCGEGAGYAGGIISAAVDGILCAEQILKSGGQTGANFPP